MSSREPLSVVVITLNEERNLERCLASVDWADDIVVVDAGSTDRTREVARRHDVRWIERPWPGFVKQKNHAVDAAAHDWVLSLDADEWLTDAGAAEIREVLCEPDAEGFSVNRRSAFAGRFLRGGWVPDWQLRLFRRERGRFEGGQVHESVKMRPGGKTRRLTERLPHLAYRSITEYVERMNHYTDLAALSMHDEGRRPSILRMVVSPPLTFCKFFFLRRGFLDGTRGWIVAAGSAFYVLLKQAKLWDRTRSIDPNWRSGVAPTSEDPEP